MEAWTLHHHHSGKYQLVLYNLPWWRAIGTTALPLLCDLTSGIAGGHGLPEWAWHIPVGKPKRDEFGLVNSLPAWLMDIETALMFPPDECEVSRIEISEEVAWEIDPEFVDQVNEFEGSA